MQHWVITRYTVSRTYPTASYLSHTRFDFTLEHSAELFDDVNLV